MAVTVSGPRHHCLPVCRRLEALASTTKTASRGQDLCSSAQIIWKASRQAHANFNNKTTTWLLRRVNNYRLPLCNVAPAPAGVRHGLDCALQDLQELLSRWMTMTKKKKTSTRTNMRSKNKPLQCLAMLLQTCLHGASLYLAPSTNTMITTSSMVATETRTPAVAAEVLIQGHHSTLTTYFSNLISFLQVTNRHRCRPTRNSTHRMGSTQCLAGRTRSPWRTTTTTVWGDVRRVGVVFSPGASSEARARRNLFLEKTA
mmetsp:Transcript_19980/g.39250  ORF Transcript_19980/g.39250 Transcript_19980/m.39250 type:complete len:258 (-) Transcript_19980:163-936(-)